MIRKANKNDIFVINNLGLEISSKFEKLFHIETEIDSEMAILLVSDNNGIDGFLYALILGDNIDLLAIVVDKAKRGRNIGSNMLKYLIDNYCYQRSITLEVAVNNVAALELYKKYGFEVVNKRVGYYDGIDALLMKWGK